jgi:hypothetical protein
MKGFNFSVGIRVTLALLSLPINNSSSLLAVSSIFVLDFFFVGLDQKRRGAYSRVRGNSGYF